jgi:hypothetical protein
VVDHPKENDPAAFVGTIYWKESAPNRGRRLARPCPDRFRTRFRVKFASQFT